MSAPAKDSPAAQLARRRWAKAGEADRERLRTLRSIPTLCPKCLKLQPSVRMARAHCAGSRAV